MHLKGGPTQDEIMAISLSKLNLKKGDIMADIGCGTGKVSLEAASCAGKVIAIERRMEAVVYACEAFRRAGATNIELREGNATEILPSIDYLDCAFVGGSGNIESVLKLLSTRVKGSIVVNAILLETMQKAVESMRHLGIFEEVILVQIARSRSLAGGVMLDPINPVYIIVGKGCKC